jgi:hypothetical protein
VNVKSEDNDPFETPPQFPMPKQLPMDLFGLVRRADFRAVAPQMPIGMKLLPGQIINPRDTLAGPGFIEDSGDTVACRVRHTLQIHEEER